MCGIAGFIGTPSSDISRAMADAMPHRGPDDRGEWHDAEVGVNLIHLRLSIVDVAGGHQPMWDVDNRVAIVFNGEIYNHAALRKELVSAGCRFASDHSDTEVILQAYLHWGHDMIRRLNGQWAFAIYDLAQKQLFLSRDRFGEKPLYYFQHGKFLAFASELPALLAHPDVPRRLSRLALAKYLAYGYVPAPRTLLDSVHQLPAGYNAFFDLTTGAWRSERYWTLEIDPTETGMGDEDALAGTLRDLLEKSVADRLVADVQVGVLLSGGIDSSSIAGLAARGGSVPKAFSIGFEEKSYDESDYARAMAESISAEHILDTLSLGRATEIVDEVLGRLDHPMADPSLLPTGLLFRHVGQHVKVALGGDGSDELFAGYDTFRALRWAQLYHKAVPAALHRPLEMVVGMLPISGKYMSLDFRLRRMLQGLGFGPGLWNAGWLAPVGKGDLASLGFGDFKPEEIYSEALQAWQQCPQDDLVDKTTQFYVNLYLQNDILAKVDRASMMYSVEARAPFLDLDLINFTRRLPSRYKLRGDTTKYLLKKAMAPVLPEAILARRKKGFGIPVSRWLRDGELGASKGNALQGRLDAAALARLRRQHGAGKRDYGNALWAVLVLERFLERTPLAA